MFTYDKWKFTTDENVKSQKNSNFSTSAGRCSGYTHQQTFFSSRGHISPLLLFLHTFLATRKKHTQSYPKKVRNGKWKKKNHHMFFQTEVELRPWKDPLLMLENQVPFSIRFHCNTSFLLSVLSDVKAIKNVQRTAPLQHASVKYRLKAVCS